MEKSHFLAVPSSRDGEHGFYLISDKNSGWIHLPEELPTGVLEEKDGGQAYKTECFKFTDNENLGGDVFITYGNYKDWTNPATISNKQPPGKTCNPTNFSIINDAETNRIFSEDLIARIKDTERVIENLHSRYLERKSRGDKSYRQITTEVDKAINALKNCGAQLDTNRDNAILDVIRQIKNRLAKLNEDVQASH